MRARFFVAAAVAVMMLCGARCFAGEEEAKATVVEMPTRRLDEMTSREVEFYFKRGGDLVFVPFGPISGHGAFIPLAYQLAHRPLVQEQATEGYRQQQQG